MSAKTTRPQPRPLQGDEGAKRSAALILEVLAGLRTPSEASTALGVTTMGYYILERRAVGGMVGALGALMPKPLGRPVTSETTTVREKDLEARIQELEVDLQAALVRTELALAMPELFRSKKNRRRRKRSGAERPAPPGSGG